ncbi:Exosome complex exonuclease RRP44 [Cucumispora dikerogammari]|nr:Exosome complex exonuclease RRP44 [Cucumispora dikerogammari]
MNIKSSSEIVESIKQTNKVFHLRKLPDCIQPFLNSFKGLPEVLCLCGVHSNPPINNNNENNKIDTDNIKDISPSIVQTLTSFRPTLSKATSYIIDTPIPMPSLPVLNKDSDQDIKILSWFNLLNFVPYGLNTYIVPLSSLEILKDVNIYAYTNFKNIISLHKICVFPDIFFTSLHDADFNIVYNRTVDYINKHLYKKRALLDIDLESTTDNTETIKNVINPYDLYKLIECGALEAANLSKQNEIQISDADVNEFFRDICGTVKEKDTHEDCPIDKSAGVVGLSSSEKSKLLSPTNNTKRKKRDDGCIKSINNTNVIYTNNSVYKHINIFRIPYLTSDKLLCVNMTYFNSLGFRCIHNYLLEIKQDLIEKYAQNTKVLIPLKVIYRQDMTTFTQIIDLNEQKGKVLVKKITGNKEKIVCKLDYLQYKDDIMSALANNNKNVVDDNLVIDENSNESSNNRNEKDLISGINSIIGFNDSINNNSINNNSINNNSINNNSKENNHSDSNSELNNNTGPGSYNMSQDDKSSNKSSIDEGSIDESSDESSIDTEVYPIVKLPNNPDLREPLNIILNCKLLLQDTLLEGRIIELMSNLNSDCDKYDFKYEVLLKDLNIEKEITRYETEFSIAVDDYDKYCVDLDINKADASLNVYNNIMTQYFKALNKRNLERTNDSAYNKDNIVDNTRLLTITIDPINCTDIDDAISVERVESNECLYKKLYECLDMKPVGKYDVIHTINHSTNTLSVNNTKNINKNGNFYNIYIHIADCSEFLSPGSQLDTSAYTRATSFYYNNSRVSMLPEVLASNFASLRGGVVRQTLSVRLLIYFYSAIIDNKDENNIIIMNSEFINDKIINKCKLSYEGAERLLNNEFVCCTCGYLNNHVNKNYSSKKFEETDTCVKCVAKKFNFSAFYDMKDVMDSLQVLIKITGVLRMKRGPGGLEFLLSDDINMNNLGDINMNNFDDINMNNLDDINMNNLDDVNVSAHNRTQNLDSKGKYLDKPQASLSCIAPEYEKPSFDTHILIEELMLLANQLAASRIYNLSPEKAVLRVHSENPDIRYTTNTTNNNALKKRKIMKQMNQAKYREVSYLVMNSPNEYNCDNIKYCDLTSETLDSNNVFGDKKSPFFHFGLNVPIYTHFTSPIRRYADILVHRVLKQSLTGGECVSLHVNNNDIINNLNRQNMKCKLLNRAALVATFLKNVTGNINCERDKNAQEDPIQTRAPLSGDKMIIKHTENPEKSVSSDVSDENDKTFSNQKFKAIIETTHPLLNHIDALSYPIDEINKCCDSVIKVFLPDQMVEGYILNIPMKPDIKVDMDVDVEFVEERFGDLFFRLL